MATLSQLLLLIAVITSGLVVWGFIVRQWWLRRPLLQAVPAEHPRWSVAVVLVTAAWIALNLVEQVQREWSMRSGESPGEPSIAGVKFAIFSNTIAIAFVCLLLSELGNRKFAEFGIRLDRWKSDLSAGGRGYLAAVPPVMLVLLLIQLIGNPGAERKHGFLRLLEQQPGVETVMWIGLVVIVTAPLFEELLYRVILQGALRSKLPAPAAIGISSVLFAAVHGFPDSLALIPLAVVLGYVFEKRRSYLAVVVLHALFNAANLGLQLLSESA